MIVNNHGLHQRITTSLPSSLSFRWYVSLSVSYLKLFACNSDMEVFSMWSVLVLLIYTFMSTYHNWCMWHLLPNSSYLIDLLSSHFHWSRCIMRSSCLVLHRATPQIHVLFLVYDDFEVFRVSQLHDLLG